MKYINYQTYLADPDACLAIERAARAARAKAIGSFVLAPIVRFCGSLLRLPTVSGPRLKAR